MLGKSKKLLIDKNISLDVKHVGWLQGKIKLAQACEL